MNLLVKSLILQHTRNSEKPNKYDPTKDNFYHIFLMNFSYIFLFCLQKQLAAFLTDQTSGVLQIGGHWAGATLHQNPTLTHTLKQTSKMLVFPPLDLCSWTNKQMNPPPTNIHSNKHLKCLCFHLWTHAHGLTNRWTNGRTNEVKTSYRIACLQLKSNLVTQNATKTRMYAQLPLLQEMQCKIY